jgi:hypothetical protein
MKNFNGPATGIDDQCFIDCECGERLSIGEEVTRCKKCGRGYQTSFSIRQFEPDEKVKGWEK